MKDQEAQSQANRKTPVPSVNSDTENKRNLQIDKKVQ